MRRPSSVLRFCFSFLLLLWLFSVYLQHETVVRQYEQNTHSFVVKSPQQQNQPPQEETEATTLNGIPVSFRPVTESSTIQCTGESDDWRFRSCHYTHLCLDTEQHDFVLIYETDAQYQQLLESRNSSTVAIGGINPRWDIRSPGDNPAIKGSDKVAWFPRLVRAETGVYQLPSAVVLVPFHSMAAHNVGHMLWDDLYPIYRLLQTFDLLHLQLLLLRYQLPEALYASCDIRRNKRLGCHANFQTFLRPMMGVDPTTFSTTRSIQWTTGQQQRSPLICAANGVAGIGTLTDHGLQDHGWDYLGHGVPHNFGHARDFWEFGRWAFQHALGPAVLTAKVPKIVFSLESSKDWDRRLDFVPYREALQAALGDLPIEAHRFWELSVEQQLQLTASTTILIATCGGGGVLPVTFLPRGSSMIVFYNPAGGYDYATGEKRPDWPVRLDWDLLQHAAAHVKVHWFPIRVADNQLGPVPDEDLDLFVKLIRHELKSWNI
ncbi:hypothetical protein FisN_13Hh299 [Fistulifera solaris]|uniref:Exostosin GT47 domain-containing protein n=1 Tax=Fistulifera solaris TaxID=1519565 RepID=A0A1Z5KNE9_FISSO|nr:hypothetical protein FisN_13Hh299 [Fistulifera solaris]|eukprot:GAX27612.1 hypothetical protein FisN_13Hh299 [Fistulifera solaris]